jgi:hypothetical protein
VNTTAAEQGCGSGSALFWKLESDPHLNEKLSLDAHQRRNSGAVEAQNEARKGVYAHKGGEKAYNGTVEGL